MSLDDALRETVLAVLRSALPAVLAELPRDREGNTVLRVSLDEFTPDGGKPAKYISLREWYRSTDGDLKPTKKGITIRRREYRDVLLALQSILRDTAGTEAAPGRAVETTGEDEADRYF
jgi:hypothetical protein